MRIDYPVFLEFVCPQRGIGYAPVARNFKCSIESKRSLFTNKQNKNVTLRDSLRVSALLMTEPPQLFVEGDGPVPWRYPEQPNGSLFGSTNVSSRFLFETGPLDSID